MVLFLQMFIIVIQPLICQEDNIAKYYVYKRVKNRLKNTPKPPLIL